MPLWNRVGDGTADANRRIVAVDLVEQGARDSTVNDGPVVIPIFRFGQGGVLRGKAAVRLVSGSGIERRHRVFPETPGVCAPADSASRKTLFLWQWNQNVSANKR